MDGGEAAKGTEPVSAAGAGDVNISVELETKGARAENCDNDDGLLCSSPIEGRRVGWARTAQSVIARQW